MRAEHRREAAGFFGNQIGHENAVDFRVFSFASKLLQAELQKRIEIAEEDYGYLGLATNGPHDLQDFCQTKSMTQGALRGSLNHWPVSHRIAERHAELDDACTSARQFENQVKGSREIRVAGGDERNETLATFAFELFELCRDSTQADLPLTEEYKYEPKTIWCS